MADTEGPSGPHLMAFGAIIQWFARHEFLMQTAMAGITGTDLSSIVVLTAGLNYVAKRDALLSLTHTLVLDADKAVRIRKYVEDLQRHNALRNAVAHSLWIPGSRPHAIKPMRVIVRGGLGKPQGQSEDERDYTPEELLQAAAAIGDIYNNFVEYLLAAKIIHQLHGSAADPKKA